MFVAAPRFHILIRYSPQEKVTHSSHVFNGLLHPDKSSIVQNISQFIRSITNLFLSEFPRRRKMLSKKHLISMVLMNVLLINCGYADARPNSETNLIDSNDKTSVS